MIVRRSRQAYAEECIELIKVEYAAKSDTRKFTCSPDTAWEEVRERFCLDDKPFASLAFASEPICPFEVAVG